MPGYKKPSCGHPVPCPARITLERSPDCRQNKCTTEFMVGERRSPGVQFSIMHGLIRCLAIGEQGVPLSIGARKRDEIVSIQVCHPPQPARPRGQSAAVVRGFPQCDRCCDAWAFERDRSIVARFVRVIEIFPRRPLETAIEPSMTGHRQRTLGQLPRGSSMVQSHRSPGFRLGFAQMTAFEFRSARRTSSTQPLVSGDYKA